MANISERAFPSHRRVITIMRTAPLVSRGGETSRLAARSQMEGRSSRFENRVHKPGVLAAKVVARADSEHARSRVPNLPA